MEELLGRKWKQNIPSSNNKNQQNHRKLEGNRLGNNLFVYRTLCILNGVIYRIFLYLAYQGAYQRIYLQFLEESFIQAFINQEIQY